MSWLVVEPSPLRSETAGGNWGEEAVGLEVRPRTRSVPPINTANAAATSRMVVQGIVAGGGRTETFTGAPSAVQRSLVSAAATTAYVPAAPNRWAATRRLPP